MYNTLITFRYHRTLAKLLPLLSLLGAYAISFADSTTLTPLSQLRTQLGVRLDSLEMEKQNLKRCGTDITALERHCRMVKDSLTQLRTLMQQGSKTIATQPPTTTARPPFSFNLKPLLSFRPADLFDWILVGTAAVALLSGLVLLTTFFGSLTRKKKRTPRTVTAPPSPTPAPRQASYKKTPSHSAPPPPPPQTPLPIEHIDSIRRRMQQNQPQSSQQPTLAPATPQQPTVPVRPVQLPGDTHQRVLTAAQQGLSPAEIAKTLQLSVDHVMLILRVAKTGRT
jgi:hypothetical protein